MNLLKSIDKIKKIKIKYLWALISSVIFYYGIFETSKFSIHSNWRILCKNYEKDNCDFLINVNYKNKVLIIYSQSENIVSVIDLYAHIDDRSDILTHPIVLEKYSFANIQVMAYYINEKALFYYLTRDNLFYYYYDWKLISTKHLNEIIDMNGYDYNFVGLKYLPNENYLILTGNYSKGNSLLSNGYIAVFNGSTLEIIWQKMCYGEDIENQNKKQYLTLPGYHWKLKLMSKHKNYAHIHQKRNNIDMERFMPVTFFGKEEFQLISAFKKNKFKKYEDYLDSQNYNSILFYHRHGLTLLDLFYGFVLGNLKIDMDIHSTYASWNGSGNQSETDIVQIKFISKLDRISNDHIDIDNTMNNFKSSNVYNDKIHCNLVFSRLQPNSDSKFLPQSKGWSIGHLCDPVSFWDYPRFNEISWIDDNNKAVPPLIINQQSVTSIGIWGKIYHIIGKKLFDINTRQVICITSDGLMSSYSSHGHLNWRVSAQVGWLHIKRMMNEHFEDSVSVKAYKRIFKPSLSQINLHYFKKKITAILSVGFDSFSVVDASNGNLLTVHSLPCTPTSPPIIVHTNISSILKLDGDRIFIFKCDNMIIGFSLNNEIPWIYIITMCTFIFFLIIFVSWILNPKNGYVY